MSDFTHLHVHSHYSLLDGLGKLDQLLARTKELGMDSLALTDHGVMYGVIEFVKTAQAYNIKPIIGVEAYLAPNGHKQRRGRMDASPRHITLLAQNTAGYKNLIQLTTQAHLHGYYYKPRIDYDLLAKHSEGLIVLSGCLNGDIAKAIVEKRNDDAERLMEWNLEIFGKERFYLEVQHHASIEEQNIANQGLISLAKKFNVHLVATSDVHYVNADDAEAQDVLLCVQTGRTVNEKDRLSMLGENFSLKPPQEIKEAWKDLPEAIDNTQRIADMCHVDIEFGVNKLPRYPLPAGQSADEKLRRDCKQGLKTRYGDSLPAGANERLDYELDVIKKTGYASYFLIVADFVNEAKRRGILVGPGRGSAAGSLVSYLMNITNLDPLRYNLLFERFLNPERVSMPDIDLDFADDRRDEIIAYVREKYGDERVAQIITFGTMAARAAVRDAGRALGFPYSFCDKVAKSIPLMSNFEEALKISSELRELYEGDPQAKKLIDTAKRLEGVCRHASTHAAGVVITDEPLTEYVPIQLSTTSGNEHDTVTQYAMSSVEALGLLKVDFLGLKNLTIIKNALDRIKKRNDVAINIDTLPLDDQMTYRLLQEGTTTGVFQLESSGMKRYLKELKPTEFEDIISMVALYRPGPMDSIPDFIAAKHGRRKISYLHAVLKPILEKTYGIIVTQDQVLQIAREFAGFTYAEADILRKAVGKKIKSLLDEQRNKFIKGAVDNKKIDLATANKVWDFIEPFARYGFNRAHAACYAMIAYQTAYLKAHYPAEFMAALLTSDEGNMDRAAIEVGEALSMGLQILPPDINESDQSFTVVATPEQKEAIRFGLGAVKNVGHNVVAALISERTKNGRFADLADLFARVNSKDFNRKSVESLARAGAMDCVGERQQILHNTEKLLNFNRALHRQSDVGQKGLFGETVAAPAPRLELETVAAAGKEERLHWEKELLGMYVSEHPLSELRQEISKVATGLNELADLAGNQSVRVVGVVTRINKIITKSNQPMLFVTIEDMTGKVEVLVFPTILQTTQEIWQDGAAVILEGKLSDKDGEVKVLTDKAWTLSKEIMQKFKAVPRMVKKQTTAIDPTMARQIIISLPRHFSPTAINKLREVLQKAQDEDGAPVVLRVPQNGNIARLQTSLKVKLTAEAVASLRQLVGQESLSFFR
ncbi:MAG: DNA polymerase III subunit alpha [Candidatus Andersenbacteria bacterium]|nr:DNA polymerase III subunit alpha [Candidatus Andersenbacteria bacterium]